MSAQALQNTVRIKSSKSLSIYIIQHAFLTPLRTQKIKDPRLDKIS